MSKPSVYYTFYYIVEFSWIFLCFADQILQCRVYAFYLRKATLRILMTTDRKLMNNDINASMISISASFRFVLILYLLLHAFVLHDDDE